MSTPKKQKEDLNARARKIGEEQLGQSQTAPAPKSQEASSVDSAPPIQPELRFSPNPEPAELTEGQREHRQRLVNLRRNAEKLTVQGKRTRRAMVRVMHWSERRLGKLATTLKTGTEELRIQVTRQQEQEQLITRSKFNRAWRWVRYVHSELRNHRNDLNKLSQRVADLETWQLAADRLLMQHKAQLRTLDANVEIAQAWEDWKIKAKVEIGAREQSINSLEKDIKKLQDQRLSHQQFIRNHGDQLREMEKMVAQHQTALQNKRRRTGWCLAVLTSLILWSTLSLYLQIKMLEMDLQQSRRNLPRPPQHTQMQSNKLQINQPAMPDRSVPYPPPNRQ
jgi:hypothetical protein